MLELVFGYQAQGERHFTSPRTGRPLLYTDPDDPGRSQARAIRTDVVRFERALYGMRFRHLQRGWRARLDPSAAIDYVLLQELFGNQDAFHASAYFHRPPGGRIVLGPIWDFDIAMGNTTLDRFRTPPGWHLGGRPYVERLTATARSSGASPTAGASCAPSGCARDCTPQSRATPGPCAGRRHATSGAGRSWDATSGRTPSTRGPAATARRGVRRSTT